MKFSSWKKQTISIVAGMWIIIDHHDGLWIYALESGFNLDDSSLPLCGDSMSSLFYHLSMNSYDDVK